MKGLALADVDGVDVGADPPPVLLLPEPASALANLMFVRYTLLGPLGEPSVAGSDNTVGDGKLAYILALS